MRHGKQTLSLSVETGFTDAKPFFSRSLARTVDQMSTPNKSGSPTLVPYRTDRQTLGAHLPVTSKGYTLEKEEGEVGEAFPFVESSEISLSLK